MGCALAAGGCAERDPLTANDVAEKPPCACGAPVTTLAAPVVEPAVAVAPRPGIRLRETVSLGYAGDGPLTQIESSREWWGDQDGGYAAYGGYAYGYGGRGGHGRGGRAGRSSTMGSTVTHSSGGHGPHFSAPTFQQGVATRGGGGGPSAPASHASGRGPR